MPTASRGHSRRDLLVSPPRAFPPGDGPSGSPPASEPRRLGGRPAVRPSVRASVRRGGAGGVPGAAAPAEPPTAFRRGRKSARRDRPSRSGRPAARTGSAPPGPRRRSGGSADLRACHRERRRPSRATRRRERRGKKMAPRVRATRARSSLLPRTRHQDTTSTRSTETGGPPPERLLLPIPPPTRLGSDVAPAGLPPSLVAKPPACGRCV